jgi:hypothetical protein
MGETLYKVPILGIWVYNIPSAVPLGRFRFTSPTSVSLLYECVSYTITNEGIFWRDVMIMPHSDFFIDFELFVELTKDLDKICDAIAARRNK